MPRLTESTAPLPQTGRLAWIGVRPAHGVTMIEVQRAMVLAGRGLQGDRSAARLLSRGRRQVTLIQAEHLPVIGALLGTGPVLPAILRRNLVISGIPLLALAKRRFTIGETLFEATGPCDPCDKMEAALGPGGLAAMVGHGGLTARALSDGEIRLGDPVRLA